jgi:hypothetical protein
MIIDVEESTLLIPIKPLRHVGRRGRQRKIEREIIEKERI